MAGKFITQVQAQHVAGVLTGLYKTAGLFQAGIMEVLRKGPV